MIDRVKDLFAGKRSRRHGRKLRKQPRRRVESRSAFRIPSLQVPSTARKRRRRNRLAVRFPAAAIKRVLFSSRWISLFLLALCVFALVTVGMDEGFYLTTIPVDGVASIPASEIVEVSGLAGAHIFAADPVEAADSIATMPGVISATVSLEWPNSALIRIKEDTPIAVWQEGDETYWITDGGSLVPARIDVPGLLHIRANDSENSDVSTLPSATLETQEESDASVPEETDREASVSGESESQIAAMPFVPEDVLQGALQLRELRPNIDVLNYDVSGGLSFQDGRGWRVYFGTGTNMAEKLAVYETLVDHLLATQETPVYISVSNQEKPFYLARDS